MTCRRACLVYFALQIWYIVVISQPSTSLYIPGFDPQPVRADIIGVGNDGRTTWALQQGKPEPSVTYNPILFIGTATLVEGPNDAFLTYANADAHFTMGQSCTFSESTLAICGIVAQGSTATQTEIITRVPIQGGATLTSKASMTTTVTSSAADGITSPSAPSPSDVASTGTGALPTTTSSSRRNELDRRSRWLVIGVWVLAATLSL
ncbi:hypothetical protein B0H34DRAFT_332303 [Crassisporium funariophilum]|nr:hypothetical protein B0H34DRAFT_332303 [Crassisporium funariophilum]